MPAFEWVHVQLHQQKGMISLSPPTICNSAHPFKTKQLPDGKAWVNDENNEPVLQDIPAPTPADLAAEAESRKAQLKTLADSEIAWREDALEAGIATEEEAAALTEWKLYRILLMRVDIANPVWPIIPN
ncbi:tail fiber assembly protein [Enterobacter hormaechei]|nr:tail fiber assembly protein [Enterobacter hormaechei]